MSEVWPGLREREPDARLEVVDGRPPTDIRRLDGKDGARVRGFVENLEAILPGITACVIPLFIGSGVRVKVLELIARGIPCVGTPVGLQGLMPLDGCFEVSEPDDSSAVARARLEEVLGRLGLREAGTS